MQIARERLLSERKVRFSLSISTELEKRSSTWIQCKALLIGRWGNYQPIQMGMQDTWKTGGKLDGLAHFCI